MATPPDFTAGAVLTAAQMNAIGLWEIKSQTIGTGVSSVQVTDAFSADYDNYRIIITGGVASTSSGNRITLGSTATGYYWSGLYNLYNNSTVVGLNFQNTTSWAAGANTTNSIFSDFELYLPFASKVTHFKTIGTQSSAAGAFEIYAGFLDNTTSYTSFTVTTTTGTLTGGTIRVYGYRN